MEKENKEDKFEFIDCRDGKEVHEYWLNGKQLTGVTTVLGIIAKDWLAPWAAKMTAESALKLTKESRLDSFFSHPKGFFGRLEDILNEAKYSHKKKKEFAGDVGKTTHKKIEEYVKLCIEKHEGKAIKAKLSNEIEGFTDKEDIKMIQKMFKNFVDWAVKNSVVFLASEVKVYSKTIWMAGTYDLKFLLDNNIYYGDVKSGRSISGREPFAQMAGYQLMEEEMDDSQPKAFGRMVIRCGKDGSFETKSSFDYETDKKIFLSCVDLYRALRTFTNETVEKGRRIKKVNKIK